MKYSLRIYCLKKARNDGRLYCSVLLKNDDDIDILVVTISTRYIIVSYRLDDKFVTLR